MEPKPIFNRRVFPDETKDDWAGRFYEAAAQTQLLYRNDGVGLTYIDPSSGPVRLMSDLEAYGIFHTVVEVCQVNEGRDGEERQTTAFLTPSEVRILFSHQAKASLPLLRAVVSEPVVVAVANNRFAAIQPGFDTQYGSGIYYYVKPLQSPIRPSSSRARLSECFSGVPFKSTAHRNNLLAWLLGGICADPRMDAPLLVVCGNQQGVGKSSTVQAAGHILTGSVPNPVDYHAQEFMKQLSARFLENERVILMDNIVSNRGRSFDNAQLSALLTQGQSKRIRILGHSRSVSASGVLFAASLNDAKLSTDLSDRSLVVQLYREINGPMTPFCKDYAIEHRNELYAELLGLALEEADAPGGPGFTNFRFRRWLDFVAPRVGRHFGSLAIEESAGIDELTLELSHWGLDHLDAEFEVDFLLKSLAADEAKYPSLCDKLYGKTSERAKSTWGALFLNARTNQYFQFDGGLKIRLLRLRDADKHQKASYVFREVKEN